ncbi:MFS transporter [Rubrobacter xylanophilus]|uniref:Putative proline/betaine transporter n=1 Tax=Rubrobacter xylanophilus TaxID=49319 RepID=A0A510HLR3_9ACTN|nr:MFS transporter [Rubrobacter xylanophilus]BBL80902.1 MFS transporter [Rubrobacter xylanophilus]
MEQSVERVGGEERGERTPLGRVITSSVVGNIIEQFDFAIYGSMAALVFGPLFFPEFSQLAGTLAALATFAVGFVARPLGSIFFGHYGDRIGRKSMLVLCLLIAGSATFLMGVLPTYAAIGIWAPVLLVTLRFVQGFSFGGEYAGAVLMVAEYAPPERRGFFSGFVPAGSPVGLMLANGTVLLVALMPREEFLAWGWRLPFLLSIVLVAIGLYIRLKIYETPAFRRVRETGTEARMPIVDVLRRSPGRVLLAGGISFGFAAIFYITIIFLLSYGTSQLGISGNVLLIGTIIGAVFQIATILGFNALSDRVGRRPVIIGGALVSAAFAFPFFWLLQTGVPALVWLAITVMMVSSGAIYGPLAVLLAELFGTRLRYSGASIGYQLGATVGGGFSPLIAASILAWSGGGPWPVALYLVVVGLVAAACTYLLTETVRADMLEDVPAASYE